MVARGKAVTPTRTKGRKLGSDTIGRVSQQCNIEGALWCNRKLRSEVDLQAHICRWRQRVLSDSYEADRMARAVCVTVTSYRQFSICDDNHILKIAAGLMPAGNCFLNEQVRFWILLSVPFTAN